MAKSSGNTRASGSRSPRGLNASGGERNLASIRAAIQASIASGGADWSNKELAELRSQEELAMREELFAQAGKNGWQRGFLNITKEYKKEDNDNPIKAMSVSVTGNLEEGSWYQVRVGGASVSSNPSYTREANALWNNDRQFNTPREAIRWAEKEANRINRKYKGKI